jgi:hypothetical protein
MMGSNDLMTFVIDRLLRERFPEKKRKDRETVSNC